jgi:hypothetical protein
MSSPSTLPAPFFIVSLSTHLFFCTDCGTTLHPLAFRRRQCEMCTAAARLLLAVTNAVKIVCVTYTDEFSAGGDAYNDLKIGHQAKIVACNSGHLSNTKAGDIVMIRSSKHITFGIIQEPIGTSDAWSSQGGESWKYNFRYLPITAILEMDTGFKQMVRDHCESNGVKHGCMFNSRLCGYGEKYKPVLKDLFSDERMKLGYYTS